MKKQKYSVLILLTCIFTALLTGFFLGRNMDRTPVQISVLPSRPSRTEPAAGILPEENTVPSESTGPAAVPESVTHQTDTAAPTHAVEKIDINTASQEVLDTLPGIGPELARRIISYRTENGFFQATADLLNVSGIGPKRLEDILDMITVGG